ncbi:hypothetical protein HOLleu_03852 [Holothuria leucospilota]|uniref:Uncharacterized protein n=1 Tax=Holothuria leucospilota TaxID=206669 RepID=A0A9Q1CT39_HOLLE|nr:hypothetical protein HOLleu_03852 [Holothuria leucospilota]
MKATGLLGEELSPETTLCSEHFEKDCFAIIRTGRRCLLKNSIRTKNLGQKRKKYDSVIPQTLSIKMFRIGQRVQAVDEIGRWEVGRVISIDNNGRPTVKFVGWEEDYNVQPLENEVRIPVDFYSHSAGKF